MIFDPRKKIQSPTRQSRTLLERLCGGWEHGPYMVGVHHSKRILEKGYSWDFRNHGGEDHRPLGVPLSCHEPPH